MDQKLVVGAGGAAIVFVAFIFLVIVSSKGGEESLEQIQFLRRYFTFNFIISQTFILRNFSRFQFKLC